jgi:hypothetical protein
MAIGKSQTARARKSASAEASRRAQLERIRNMTIRERMLLALDLGRTSRKLGETLRPPKKKA